MMEKIDIKDASIAETIRGNMPVATGILNGLMSSNLVTGKLGSTKIINFDTYNGETPVIATKGINSGTSPNGENSSWFILWQYSSIDAPYKVQIAVGISSSGLYTRNYTNKGDWESWVKY